MDRLSNILSFITVAETGSFAETARKLHIANSVVSKRISDLEDYLGVRLLQRSTRKVSLTDAGYLYMEQARRIMDELAEVEEQIKFQNENPVGEVRLSAPMSFANLFLGSALAWFLEKYPDVSLKLSISEHPLAFENDTHDIAIFIGHPKETSLITRKIAETRRIVVASPGYLEKYGRPQTPQDLLDHNCISYSRLGDGKSWPFMTGDKQIWQPIQGRFASESGTLLCEAAVEGCGITMLPSFIAGKHVVEGQLEILLENYEEPPLPILAVFAHKRHLSARVRKLIDHLVQYFEVFDQS